MGFVTPDFGHWAGLLEAKGPPKEGRGRNFREAHERQKEGERCQKEGFGYRFGGFLEGKNAQKSPFPRVGIAGADGFVMSYFIVFLLFR